MRKVMRGVRVGRESGFLIVSTELMAGSGYGGVVGIVIVVIVMVVVVVVVVAFFVVVKNNHFVHAKDSKCSCDATGKGGLLFDGMAAIVDHRC